MGFHRTSATRNMRTPRAHLDVRCDNNVYGVYRLGFSKNSPSFEYCFIGEEAGTLTFEGNVIDKHPKFKAIDALEKWCRCYVAEHDL